MNIKKVFASLTGVLMLATTVTPLVTGAAHYGAELEGAYAYAYSKSITTMPSIDSANMYGDLTRAELAKMISNWAENELGQKPDLTQLCSFADEGEVYGDLPMYLKKACQMGLMGRGLVKFRPNDKVTRAEFGTTLSRALWGSKYEGGNPYYVNHLQALRDEGIMKMITTPSQLEKRGYVMLMLQRSSARKDAVNCADPMVTLACSVGGENCPSACKKAEAVDNGPVKAGDLRVTATPAVNRRAILNGKTSDLDTITLQATEAVNLQRVTLERYGYSTGGVVAEVWLEDENGNQITEEGTINKDQVTLRVRRDYRNLSNKVQFTIVLKTTDKEVTNGTIGFKVKDVVSSAKNLDISAYTPYEYDLVKYDGTSVTITKRGKSMTHNYESNVMYEVGRFQVKAQESVVLVKGLTLKNVGTIDLDKYFDKAEVVVDTTKLNNVKATLDRYGKTVTLSFDPVKIEYNKRANFLLNMSLRDLDIFGKNIHFEIESLNAVELKTNSRVTSHKTALESYTFGGGKIRLTNTKLPSVIEAAKGSLNVVIAEGDLELARAVRLSGFVIEGIKNLTQVQAVRMLVGSEDFDGKLNVAADGTGSISFNPITLEKNSKIKFVVDLKEGEQDDKVTDIVFSAKSFSKALFAEGIGTYDDVRDSKINEKDFIGSISFSSVRLQPAKGNLYNNSTKPVEFISEQASRKEIFNGEYTAQKGDVTLTDFAIASTSRLAADENIDFRLYVNGKHVGSRNIAANDAVEGYEAMDRVIVKKGEKVKVTLEATVYGKLPEGETKKEYAFTLQLKGEDADGIPAGESRAIQTAKVSVVRDGSVLVSDTAKSAVVLKNTGIKLAEFTVRPAKEADVLLSTIEFEVEANKLKAEDLRVNINGNIAINGTQLTITDINETIDTSNGLMVELTNVNDLEEGDYALKLKKVNGVGFSKVFDKKVVSAIVSVKKMENLGDITRLTLKVDKANASDTITNFSITGISGSLVAGPISDGEEIVVKNEEDTQFATAFTYTVNNAAEATTITKAKYGDFFLLDRQPVRAFSKQ